jgi:Rrf2 family protein
MSSRFAVAVHILALLGTRGDAWVTSDYAAGSVKTNPVVVRRLLGLLRRAGLVRIQPGPRGGARLARPADRITLAEVYQAVEEGQLLGLHRHPPNPRCPVGRNIGGVLGGVFGEAESALLGVLKRKSIEDVVKDVGQCATE